MDILYGMSTGASDYMKNIDPHHWNRAHFKTIFKCDILLNNLCEYFNNHILEARIKGIVTMNEMIKTRLMIRDTISNACFFFLVNKRASGSNLTIAQL